MVCACKNGSTVGCLASSGHLAVERKSDPTACILADRAGSGELSGDSYGEAFVPKQYIERELSSCFLIDFTERVPNVNQAVVVLKRIT